MAVRENIDTFVNDFIDERIESAFIQSTPLFYFMGVGMANAKNPLRRETGNMLFGGAKMSSAERLSKAGSEHHQFRFMKGRYGTTAGVEYGGATPSASGFTEDNFFTAQTQWSTFSMAAKTREHSFLFAEDAGDLAIGNFVDEQLAEPWDHFVTDIHQSLWTGTLTGSQQDARVWAGQFLGLQHQLTEDNVYGRRDRTQYAGLQPSYVNAATDFSGGANASLEWIRYINNGFTRATAQTKFQGLHSRKAGGGPRCWMTTSDIFNDLANQADGRYQIHTNGIPGTAMGGFKRPIIQFDDSYITWDDDCPDGEWYGLNLNYLTFEIHRKKNFAWTGYTNKSRTEEGGEAYEWGLFELMARFTNRAPWLSVRIDNVTTSSV